MAAPLVPAGFTPSKILGQNFLIDENLCRRLVDALDLGPEDTVLEVGPGTGALTTLLLDRAGRVVAIEKDPRLAAALRDRWATRPTFTLIQADFLEWEPPGPLGSGSVKVMGNLPYSITGPALVRILAGEVPRVAAVLTIQREVAQKLTAAPGTEHYGRISVLAQLAGTVRTVCDLPPGAFWPPPRVVSRAVHFVPSRDFPDWRGSRLEAVIKSAFAERRKQATKSMASTLQVERPRLIEVFERLGLGLKLRAEDIAPVDFLRLTEELGPELEAQ